MSEQEKSLSETLEMDKSEDSVDLDRLSDLPQEIIHHIVSFLPTKDATRTSLLSKRFRSLWASYPIIDFDSSLFFTKEDWPSFSSREFLNFSRNSLRLRDPKASILKFRLHDAEVIWDEQLEELIEFVVEHGAKELVLDIFELKVKSLPEILFSNRSVTALELRGLKFQPMEEDSAVVLINCPFIKTLSLKYCSGMKNLKVSCQSLREIKLVGFFEDFMKIEMDARNLESFLYVGNRRKTELHFGSCKSLKTLVLEGIEITYEFLGGQISTLPLLESLKLKECQMPTRSRISSASLKILELGTFDGLTKLEIEAPNLQSFIFVGNYRRPCVISLASCNFLRNLNLMEADINKGWMEECLAALTRLEILTLRGCNMPRKIKISHQNMKSFALLDCDNMKEAKICTKNLSSLRYLADFQREPLRPVILADPALDYVSILKNGELNSSSVTYFDACLRFGCHPEEYRSSPSKCTN